MRSRKDGSPSCERKGGIHEGREGFSFAHDSFHLFPTKFHAQLDHVREGEFVPDREWKEGDTFPITHHAEAAFAVTLTDWGQVEGLYPFHVYTGQTLKERFDWEGKGMASGSIHLALVRVFRLESPFELTYEKKFGGCRSWLEIPSPPTGVLEKSEPVIHETAFEKMRSEIEVILGQDTSAISG